MTKLNKLGGVVVAALCVVIVAACSKKEEAASAEILESIPAESPYVIALLERAAGKTWSKNETASRGNA